LQQMESESDAAVIEACRREGRPLVTLDLDFANPLDYLPSKYACQRRSDDRMKRAGLKTGCERAFIFFKSFSQNSSSFVLFFVLFGGARGLDFLRSCTIQATESAAHFESADEFPIKV